MSVINTNITSMIGQSNLSKSQNALQTSMERLSSGLRINSAKDDAAGQAIANRMTSQITGLAQAQRNANDGISIAQTAEGSLNQINDNLQRVRELTVQAQNGTNSASDIDSIQQEVNQRLEEIDRIARETDFNGTNVLDVSEETTVNIQVGAKDGETIGIKISDQAGWNLFQNGSMAVGEIGGEQRNVEALGFDVRSAVAAGGSSTAEASGIAGLDETEFGTMDTFTEVREYTDEDGNTAYAAIGEDGGGDPVAYAVTFNADGEAQAGDLLTGADSTAALASSATVADGDTVTVAPVTISGIAGLDETEFGTMDTFTEVREYTDEDGNTAYAAIGEDGGGDPVAYAVNIDENGAATAGAILTGDNLTAALASTDTVTDGDALATGDTGAAAGGGGPLAALDAALAAVDAQRSELGAIQNRFEDAITNLNTNETNLAEARSRIEDADYAVEVANMTRAQILQQAGTSVLAQANQIPQSVLSLLG